MTRRLMMVTTVRITISEPHEVRYWTESSKRLTILSTYVHQMKEQARVSSAS